MPARRLIGALAALVAAIALVTSALAGDGPEPVEPARPEIIEEVHLVAGCQIRAFMPHYLPGTALPDIAASIQGGNPRFWFMHAGPGDPVPLPSGLFDPASPERSIVEILTEEAGYVCVDFATTWLRPPYPPVPPCTQEPCPLGDVAGP